MNITEYADRELLVMSVANILAGALKKSLSVNDTVSLAVAGGTTPGPIFDLLSATDLDWDRVHVMLTDERWVSEDHPQSNTRLVKQRLITDKAAAAQFVSFYRAGMTAAEGCADVAPTLTDDMPISVMMLGMGDDMHTASLFPGSDGLATALNGDAPLLCPIKVEGQDIERVTLPAHALEGAMSKHLVIFGDDKRAALERAFGQPAEVAPVAAVLTGATIHWAA